jgi:hypothetical protein
MELAIWGIYLKVAICKNAINMEEVIIFFNEFYIVSQLAGIILKISKSFLDNAYSSHILHWIV